MLLKSLLERSLLAGKMAGSLRLKKPEIRYLFSAHKDFFVVVKKQLNIGFHVLSLEGELHFSVPYAGSKAPFNSQLESMWLSMFA